jgi:hypothetical protein
LACALGQQACRDGFRVRYYHRLKDHAAIAGKEDKTKKIKSKSNEPATAEPAS